MWLWDKYYLNLKCSLSLGNVLRVYILEGMQRHIVTFLSVWINTICISFIVIFHRFHIFKMRSSRFSRYINGLGRNEEGSNTYSDLVLDSKPLYYKTLFSCLKLNSSRLTLYAFKFLWLFFNRSIKYFVICRVQSVIFN